jgi:hypothetical protein
VIRLALGLPTAAVSEMVAPLLVELDRNFGKDVNAADLCGYAELRPVFDTDNGGLAAHPAPLPGCQFGRKNENQFHVGSLLHFGVGVEKHAVGADVPGLSLEIRALLRTHPRGNAGHDAGSGAALGLSLHAQESPDTLHQDRQIRGNISGLAVEPGSNWN